MNSQRRIAFGLVIITIVSIIVIGTVGISYAQGPGGNNGRGGYGPNDGPQGAPPQGYGQGAGVEFGYNAGLGMNPGANYGDQTMLDAVASVLGIDSTELFALRQTGATYAAIASEYGVDIETLIDALALQHQASLEAQLQAGLISPDQALWMQVEMRENIRARLTDLWELGPMVGQYTSFYGINALNQFGLVTGMTPTEVVAALQNGQSLQNMALLRNIDLQLDLIEPLVEQERVRLQLLIDASLLAPELLDPTLEQYRLDTEWRFTHTPPADFGPGSFGSDLSPLTGVGLPPVVDMEMPAAVIDALTAGLQDEYHAYAVYQVVIDQFGPVAPFVQIQAAEAQHIAALEVIFNRYGLDIPAPLPLEDLPAFASIADACALGAAAEIANVELYDTWLNAVRDYPDIVQVFTALRNASQFNHLPAFQSCAG